MTAVAIVLGLALVVVGALVGGPAGELLVSWAMFAFGVSVGASVQRARRSS